MGACQKHILSKLLVKNNNENEKFLIHLPSLFAY